MTLTVRGKESDAPCRVRLLKGTPNQGGQEVRRIESSEDRTYHFEKLPPGDYSIEAYFMDSYPTHCEPVHIAAGEDKVVRVHAKTDQVARIRVEGRVLDKRTGGPVAGLRIEFVGAPEDDAVTDEDGRFATTADRARFHQTLVTRDRKVILEVDMDNDMSEEVARKLEFHVHPLYRSIVPATEVAEGVFCDRQDCPICDGTIESSVSKPKHSGKENTYQHDLQALFNELDKNYPFFDLKDIRDEWEQTKLQLMERVGRCKSDTEFMDIVREATNCLRDSHVWLNSPKVRIPRPAPQYSPPVGFMPGEDNAVLVMVTPPGQEKLLPKGTIVKTIDGVDAKEYLDARAEEEWQSGGCSSPQRARLYAWRIALIGKKGEKHKIVVQGQDGDVEVELASTTEARGWPHVYNLPDGLIRVGRSFSYTCLPSGVGYMYLRRVDASVTRGIQEATNAHPDAPGWIVDLRGNGGGGYGQELIDGIKKLPRPVGGLIDAGCISAGETLARDLRRYADARLFGTRTAGASSDKKEWQFPSGIASLTLPVRSRWRADGKPIEFNGIEPDEEVLPVPADVLKGLNTEILVAEEYVMGR